MTRDLFNRDERNRKDFGQRPKNEQQLKDALKQINIDGYAQKDARQDRETKFQDVVDKGNKASAFVKLSGIFGRESVTLPKPISTVHEEMLLEKANIGDKAAREDIIESNLYTVVNIAKGFMNRNTELDDLISTGTLGLMKAIDSFDPAKNKNFENYKTKCIQNEIKNYLKQESRERKNTVSFDELT